MFCSVCGNKCNDGAAFCSGCGAAIASVAPQAPATASVDEPTMGIFDSVPPVAPQPVTAPATASVDEPTMGMFDSVPPVAPQPVMTPVTVPVTENNVPVVDETEKKKSKKTSGKKKGVLFGVLAAVALVLVVGIIAVVAIFTSPKMTIIRAAKKTLLDSSGFSFEVYMTGEGKVGEGKVSFGDGYKDSGFYFAEGDGYYSDEYGYYNNTIYDNWGSYNLQEDIDYINEELNDYGFGITVEDALDRLIDGEVNEKAILEIYEEEYDNIQSFLEDELGVDIDLPLPKDVMSDAGNILDAIPKDALIFEKESKSGQKIYKYEVDLEDLIVGVLEDLAEDEEYDQYFDMFEEETGYDVDDLIDEIKEEEWPEIDGEVVIEKGYLVEFSIDFDFDGYKAGYKIKFSDINDTVVKQSTMDNIEIMEDYYYDDYYYDDYYYYDEEYYDYY